MSCASATSQRRAEPAQKIIPSAHAPDSAARWASARFVIPQCLIRVGTRLIVEGGRPPVAPAARRASAGARAAAELDGHDARVVAAHDRELHVVAGPPRADEL